MRTYVTHYFNFEYIGIYLLVSLIGLAVVIGIVLGVAKLKTRQRLQDDSLSHKAIRRINRHHQERKRSIIESFFEMVFASTSVLIFLCFSVILNGWLDIVFVPLEEIDSNQKASIRLVSSFYIILILLYIKFIYNDDNYDSLMMYFITLAVGRFIYFDFTMDDFLSTLHGFWEELPLLILMASYSGFVWIPAYV